MDALRKSIGSDTSSKGKKPRKASAGQKEMLLPIEGKAARKRPSPNVQRDEEKQDNFGCQSVRPERDKDWAKARVRNDPKFWIDRGPAGSNSKSSLTDG
jgi:hypothetical protein